MGLGRMSYSESTACADNLRLSADNLEKQLADLREEINSMDEVLRSEGSEQLLRRYEELDSTLKDCPGKIVSFEAYLREAIEKYKDDDQQMKEESRV